MVDLDSCLVLKSPARQTPGLQRVNCMFLKKRLGVEKCQFKKLFPKMGFFQHVL